MMSGVDGPGLRRVVDLDPCRQGLALVLESWADLASLSPIQEFVTIQELVTDPECRHLLISSGSAERRRARPRPWPR